MEMEDTHRCGRLRSSGERNAEEHVHRKSHRGNGKIQNGKGFRRPGVEHIKNYGQQVISVRTPDGFVRKSTWQVADVRRPLVSESQIIQAGHGLFIGKNVAQEIGCSS